MPLRAQRPLLLRAAAEGAAEGAVAEDHGNTEHGEGHAHTNDGHHGNQEPGDGHSNDGDCCEGHGPGGEGHGHSHGSVEEGVEEPSSVLPELFELAAKASLGDAAAQQALDARVDANFARISTEDVAELQVQVGAVVASGMSGNTAAELLAASLQEAVTRRMAGATKDIAELIGNADGDVNVGIRKLLKKAESPLPLIMVLQLNIGQAQMDGEEDKVRVLMHINTVINEELEKKASRVQALLNKLMRMDVPGIRENLLRHHLTPVQVGAGPGLDDDDADFGAPQLSAALVTPPRLAAAISDFVKRVDQQLRMASDGDDELRFEQLERIRTVAKEARLVILDIYGEGEMASFGQDLTPAFTTLMQHKATREQASEVAPGNGASSTAMPPTAPTAPRVV